MDPANGAGQVSGSFLTPLLISLAGIVATSLALIAYHFLLVRYCMRQRDQANEARHSSTGVEHAILETIPILSFSREKVKELGTDQFECVVCLAELKEGETVRFLPNCRHLFHVLCIDNWFSAHSTCPVCRTLVDVTSDFPGEKAQNMGVGQGSDQAATSTSGAQSNATLVRHCVSLVFPRENKTEHLIRGLKRSLSMDQFHVCINLIDHDSGEAQNNVQLDRMSSLLRSLRVGRSSSTSYGNLPY